MTPEQLESIRAFLKNDDQEARGLRLSLACVDLLNYVDDLEQRIAAARETCARSGGCI